MLAVGVLVAVGVLLAAAGLLGCGSGTPPSRRELALERVQLVQVSDELREVKDAVAREVKISRAAWPFVSDGLPRRPGPRLRAAVSAASASAGDLPAPTFMAKKSTLTGPASAIAGLYEDYDRLAERGWRLTETTVSAIASGPASVASFVRENSSLYIDAIYDGHFYLSLIGKKLLDGYKKIGGPSAFGGRLTQPEVEALAAFYSIPAVRLLPHPGPGVEER